MSEQRPRNGRSPLILFIGFSLLGMALALLIFGNRLFDRGETAVFPQIPSLDTLSAISPLANSDQLLEVGSLAQNFTLQDLQNNNISLSDFAGQPIILNFWATWCEPCRVEMPTLQAAYEKYKDDGLIILALDQDESPQAVSSFFYDEFNLTFTPLLDVGQTVSRQYTVFSYPATFFINRDGIISAIHRGPVSQSQLENYLASILPQSALPQQ